MSFWRGWFWSFGWIMRVQWWKNGTQFSFLILNYYHWHLWMLWWLQESNWLSCKGNCLRVGDWFPTHHSEALLAHHWMSLILSQNDWNDMSLFVGIRGMMSYYLVDLVGWIGCLRRWQPLWQRFTSLQWCDTFHIYERYVVKKGAEMPSTYHTKAGRKGYCPVVSNWYEKLVYTK